MEAVDVNSITAGSQDGIHRLRQAQVLLFFLPTAVPRCFQPETNAVANDNVYPSPLPSPALSRKPSMIPSIHFTRLQTELQPELRAKRAAHDSADPSTDLSAHSQPSSPQPPVAHISALATPHGAANFSAEFPSNTLADAVTNVGAAPTIARSFPDTDIVADATPTPPPTINCPRARVGAGKLRRLFPRLRTRPRD